ncbi:hypothetical protein TURU_011287 [Turdus rufiventris]|nr:hypothetical protein TURU_011287 [Turdus rufiventris]
MWRSAARCFQDFISESLKEVFLVGLESLARVWMERGEKPKSAIFNFQSLLTVILLLICTCAYIRSLAPSLLDKNKTGFWALLNCTELFVSSDICTQADQLYLILDIFP